MYILIKILQGTLLVLVSLTLHIIPWIPSWTIENIVNFSSIGLFVGAGYLVYLSIKRLYDTLKKPNIYKSTMYTVLLFTYLGGIAILQIGIALGKSKYLRTYQFENKTFYIYETLEGGSEVSKKDDPLPIRSLPIATFPTVLVELQNKGLKIYAQVEGTSEMIYDLDTQKP